MKSNYRKLPAIAIVHLCLGMLPPTAVHAATYSIANMNITSGGFTAFDYLNQPFDNPSSGGSYTPFTIGSNTNLVGGYLGNASSGVVSGLWYNTPANLYTAPSNIGSAFMPTGSIQGGSVPGGTLDNVAMTIKMDLSAIFVYWGGADFHQGTGKIDGVTSSFATGIWDPNTGLYNLSWISNIDPIVCGPLGPTCSATYTLEGYAVASTVPIPAAAYLFGSGLIGLAGFARKRKADC